MRQPTSPSDHREHMQATRPVPLHFVHLGHPPAIGLLSIAVFTSTAPARNPRPVASCDTTSRGPIFGGGRGSICVGRFIPRKEILTWGGEALGHMWGRRERRVRLGKIGGSCFVAVSATLKRTRWPRRSIDLTVCVAALPLYDRALRFLFFFPRSMFRRPTWKIGLSPPTGPSRAEIDYAVCEMPPNVR